MRRSWLLGTITDDKLKTASINPNSVVFGIKPNVKLNVFVWLDSGHSMTINWVSLPHFPLASLNFPLSPSPGRLYILYWTSLFASIYWKIWGKNKWIELNVSRNSF